jgi:HK97 family phage major capsid protein
VNYIELARESYAKGQAIILEAETKKVALTPEQEAQVDKFFDEADAHKKRADRMKREADLKAAIADTARGNPVRTHPMGEMINMVRDGEGTYIPSHEAEQKALKLFGTEPVRDPMKDYLHHEFLKTYLRRGNGFLQEVQMKAIADAEFKDLSTLTDPEGGAIVSVEFSNQIITKMRNNVEMRQLATVIRTSAGAISFPSFDPSDTDTDIPVSLPNGTVTVKKPSNVFGKMQFTPHKRIVIFPIPIELIEDATVDVLSLFSDFFAMRGAELDENDFINGNGVTRPLGIMQATGIPANNIAGATTSIVQEDLIDLIYSMRAVYPKNARWMLHRNVIRKIRKFRTAAAGAGTGDFIWQAGLQAGQPATLLGYQVIESEFFPDATSNTAAAGDPMALFGDFKWYWIIDRTDWSLQRLNERYADSDQVGVKLRKRTDGAPVMAEAFIRLNRQ